MASLTAHLRESGDHGRLPFHPACPVCCEERLAGSLPADGVVGHRTQALLAAGVLAFSASAPASVMAAQGDEEFVGSGDPNAFTAPGSEPDAGPDGDREELPEDPDPADSDDDPATLETDDSSADQSSTAPATSGGATPRSAPATGQPQAKQPTTSVPEQKPLAAASPAAGVPASAPAAPAAPALSTPASGEAAAAALGDAVWRAREAQRSRHGHSIVEVQAREGGAPRVVRARPQATAPLRPPAPHRPMVAAVGTTHSAVRVVEQGVVGEQARPGDRAHVVVAGESLWSIAGDVLGGRASDAQVAREVDRLWALNRERIGTGDRNVLPVGARLVLR